MSRSRKKIPFSELPRINQVRCKNGKNDAIELFAELISKKISAIQVTFEKLTRDGQHG